MQELLWELERGLDRDWIKIGMVVGMVTGLRLDKEWNGPRKDDLIKGWNGPCRIYN